MSMYQLNQWEVTCDLCGHKAVIPVRGDSSPSPTELLAHGFRLVFERGDSDIEYESLHYCAHCYHDIMKEE